MLGVGIVTAVAVDGFAGGVAAIFGRSLCLYFQLCLGYCFQCVLMYVSHFFIYVFSKRGELDLATRAGTSAVNAVDETGRNALLELSGKNRESKVITNVWPRYTMTAATN